LLRVLELDTEVIVLIYETRAKSVFGFFDLIPIFSPFDRLRERRGG